MFLRLIEGTRTMQEIGAGQPVSKGHVLRGLRRHRRKGMSDRTRKLVSIRHRTDHDLLVLVSRELDRSFALVDLVTTRTSPLFAQAEKAHETARAILPRMSRLSGGAPLHLES